MSRSSENKKTDDDKTSPCWRRTLYIVWLTEFIAVVAFTVIMPILPLYVKELGVRSDKQAMLWSGLVLSAQSLTMMIVAPVWGALSDHHGRKVMVERAILSGAVVMALMGLAQNVQQLTLLRALQGMLGGSVTAATTLVATTVPRKHLGYAIGSLQMAVYVGASVGPLVGGVVADALSYRTVFWLTSVLLLLAGFTVLSFVRESPTMDRSQDRNHIAEAQSRPSLRSRTQLALSPVLGSAVVLGLLSIRLLMRLAVRLPTPSLPLFVEMITPPGSRVATITGLTTGLNAFAAALGGRQLGKLSDRVGHRSILIACSVASVFCYLPQSFVERSLTLIILQGGAGLAMGGILASISAALGKLAPEGREGIVYGVDASVVAAANAMGPMAGSLVAAYCGLRAPFLAAAGVSALASVVGCRLLPRS
jgi:DHA1 family multidrug resistance protein-like MFS transporter